MWERLPAISGYSLLVYDPGSRMQSQLQADHHSHSGRSSSTPVASNAQYDEFSEACETSPAACSSWSLSPCRRWFDVSASFLVFVPLLPVLLLIAVVIRATSPGAAIFRQQRIGRHGLPFTILKFRTMHASLPGSGRSSHEDHRLTGPGRFLRRYKLDELPQLMNVIRGDMSLVGPRPKLLDHHTLDLCVRPGVTGAATLAFASEELLLREIAPEHLEACHHQLVSPRKLELDLDYMARATFRSDLSLLWQTLMRTGRYTSLADLGRWTAPATEAAAADGILPWPARTAPEREAPGSARAWMQHGEQLSLVPGGFHRSEITPPAASS